MSEKEIAILHKELEYVNKNIQDLYQIIKNHTEKEENQWEKFVIAVESKYSWKWVEKVVGGAVSMTLISVFWYIISLAIK